jgi:hypothetical protein
MTLLDQFIRAKKLDTRELERHTKISDAFLSRLRSGKIHVRGTPITQRHACGQKATIGAFYHSVW